MSLYRHIRRLWALEDFKPDVPLSRDEASRFLPWIIALMVYLAALTLAGSFTLHHTVLASHASQTESFSVHLPHAGEKNEENAAKALAVIKNTSGVKEANIITLSHIKELVEPWLGKSDALNALPLPTVIEAKLEPGSAIDYAQLKARLDAVAGNADIDNHRQWMEQFTGVVRVVQWILFAISFFIIVTTAAVVIFSCKTSLKIHRGTVNLLHRLGALDSYIAHQFQTHAALLALKGAFVGSGFAAGTILILHLMARHIDSPLFPSFTLSGTHGLILLFLPLGMSLIALLSARMSVLATLHKMP